MPEILPAQSFAVYPNEIFVFSLQDLCFDLAKRSVVISNSLGSYPKIM